MNSTSPKTALLVVLACIPAFSDTVIIPNAQASQSGGAEFDATNTAVRFQQVLGSGQFSGPIVISGIRLRSAPNKGPLSVPFPNLVITLSTTQAFPNTTNGHTLPSTTFADNIGPDAVAVFSGPMSISSPGCTGAGPCPFDVELRFSTPFSFDPTKGRLLVDMNASAPTTAPTGSYDGVGFSDSTTSTVAYIAGDPASPTGDFSLGGMVMALETGIQAGTPLNGSFGFLINSANATPASYNGFAILGVMNLDPLGNVTGTYTFQGGATDTQAAQTQRGNLTGTYSTNPDGTGSLTVSLAPGLSITFAMVINSGGQGLQFVSTKCTFSCSATIFSGFARPVYTGTVAGTYGFHTVNSPEVSHTLGVLTFDGAGNVAASVTVVDFASPGGNSPTVGGGTVAGTYSVNPDGSGSITVGGGSDATTLAFVSIDGGSGILLLKAEGTGFNVATGSGRLQ